MAVKLGMGGAIESGSEALIDGYFDPNEVARLVVDPEPFAEYVRQLDEAGFQLKVHAIGDGSVRATLDGYQRVIQANGNNRLRHHIDHCKPGPPGRLRAFRRARRELHDMAAVERARRLQPRRHWFAGAPIDAGEYPGFAATGILSFFGSVNVAVPFLLDLFRILADMFQFFVASGVINSRFGTLVAAAHVVVLAVAGTCAANGTLVFRPQRLVRFALVSLGLIVLTIGTTRVLFSRFLEQKYDRDQVVTGMHLLRQRVPTVVHQEPPDAPPLVDATRSQLAQIRERGVLRVGYFAIDSRICLPLTLG